MMARFLSALPLLAGPLALVGFFLPWFEGTGLLAGERYNGYNALQFGAWLQDAGLSGTQELVLHVGRAFAVGIVVASIWLAITAPRMRDHAFYAISGWYLVAAAIALVVAGFAWQGGIVPQPGLATILAAALCWLAPGFHAAADRIELPEISSPAAPETGR
jgi:hypothetical protein